MKTIASTSLVTIVLAAAAHAQFLVPDWRGNAQTEAAEWDVFSQANLAPNVPDQLTDTPTSDAALTCTTSSAFLTSSGNIYSFSSALSLQLDDSANYPVSNVVLQVRSLGNVIDQSSVRLILPDGQGDFSLVAPTRSFLVDQQQLSADPDGPSQGGLGELWLYQWDLSGSPVPAGETYTILFSSEGSSMSLDAVSLDTADSYAVIEQGSTAPFVLRSASTATGEIELRYPAAYDGQVVLQSADSPADIADWTDLSVSPVLEGAECVITLTPNRNQGFFRLKQIASP